MIVEEGRFYNTNKLKDVEEGSRIEFGRVLAAKLGDNNYEFGKPYLSNVKVEAEVIEHYKADKVLVFKFKPKKHYQRKRGHR